LNISTSANHSTPPRFRSAIDNGFKDDERKIPTDRKVKSYAIDWSKRRARCEKLPRKSNWR